MKQLGRQAVCVSLRETAGAEPEGSWKMQTSSSDFLGSRLAPYPAAIEEAEPDVAAEDPHAGSRQRDHLAAAQSDNQGHSGGSRMDLKHSRRRIRPPGHVESFCVLSQPQTQRSDSSRISSQAFSSAPSTFLGVPAEEIFQK